MKNINVKKIVAGAAALAVGASFLGAAVASQVDFGSAITKDDVLTNGTPTAKIVVGTGGLPIDVVYAGNIAAAIASKAYKTETFTTEPITVPGTPGSSSNTVSGDGKLYDNVVLNDPSNLLFRHTDTTILNNETVDVDGSTTYDGVKFSSNKMNVRDQIDVTGATFGFNKDKKVADIVGSFPTGSLKYTVTFGGSGIPVGYKDSNSDERLTINFMGKKYIVDQVEKSYIKLLLDKSDYTLKTGDTFEPEAGYTIEVGDFLSTTVGGTTKYEVELILMKNGSPVKTEVFAGSSTVFKKELDAVVKINTVYNSRVTITMGDAASLTLTDSKDIEDFPKKGDELWEVSLLQNTGSVNTYVTSVVVTNNNDYELLDEDAIKMGGSIEAFGGFASVDFVGLTDESKYDFKVENGTISYVDVLGNDLDLFMFEHKTGSDIKKFTTKGEIDGHRLYIDLNAVEDGAAGKFTIQQDDSDGDYLSSTAGAWVAGKQLLNYADGNWAPLSIKSIDNSGVIYNYGIMITETGDKITNVAIGLKDNTTVVPSKDIKGIATEITLAKVDNNPKDGNIIDATEKYLGWLTDTTAAKEENEAYGEFKLSDGDANILVYVDAFTGKLVDTEDADFDDISYMVNEGTYRLGVKNSDDLRWGMTNKGIKFEIDSRAFKAEIPEYDLKARVFVGAGSEITVTPGQPGSTIPGTTYTVTTPVNYDFSKLVVSDIDPEPAGTLIVVGGHMANKAAINVTEEYLTQAGQWIMGKDPVSGKIVVAGYTADDTKSAANAFINAIQ